MLPHGATYAEAPFDRQQAGEAGAVIERAFPERLAAPRAGLLVHRFPTVEQAEAFAASDELREAMGRAGVVGRPRIEIAVEA